VSKDKGKSRLSRRLAIAAAVLAALVVAAALLLPVLVDVNQYRGLIQTEAEKALGRPVTLGRMSMSLFPAFGIKVEEPAVAGLLTARSLTVGARLWPLIFGGTIELSRVILDHPEITITRKADGSWDVEDLGAGAGGATDAPEEGAGRGFSLSRLGIAGGLVHLRSMARRGAPESSVDLQLDLEASLDMPAGGDLTAAFDGNVKSAGIELDLSGKVSREAGTTRFDVSVGRSAIEVQRARALAAVAGFDWPVPEGVLESPSLGLSGQAEGRIGASGPERIALSGVTITDADVRLSRDRRGVWNVAALAGGDTKPPGGGGDAGPEVIVSNLSLDNARLRLHDESSGASGAAVDLELADLSLRIEKYEPGKPVTLSLKTRMAPGKGAIAIDGTLPTWIGKDSVFPIDARVDLSSVEVAPLAGYLKSLLDTDAKSGTVSVSATVDGDYPRKVRAKGTLSLDAVKVEAAPKPVTAKADFDLAAADGARRIEIASLQVGFGDSRLSVQGTIDNRGAGTIADLTVPPASVDAADLVSVIAVAGVELPVTFTASSPVRLEARIRGDLAKPAALDLTGSVEVARATLQHASMAKPLEKVEGKVTLRKDGFDVTGFSGVIGSSDVSGRMSVKGFDASDVTFALTSKHADFWELMSFIRGDEGASGGAPAAATPAGGDDPLARIAAKGTLAIGEGSFGTLAFRQLDCGLSLDRKVIRLDPVGMSLYGGTMNGSASMDMNRDPAVYAVTASTAAIDTDALLSAVLDMKGMLAGALSANMSVRASGSTLDQVLSAAKGSGSVRIENGRVGAINVLKVLSRASDVLGERSLQEVSGRLAKEGTDFSLMTADLQVSDGKISSGNLSLKSPDLDLKDDGTLDMLAGTIQVEGEIVFSEALSQAMVQEKSKAADYFWDGKRERVALPLTMAGPLDAPMPNIDWKTAGGRLARRRAEDSVRGRLEKAGLGDLLGSKPATPPRVAPQAPQPSEPAPPAPEAVEGLSARIEETELAGNILMRDLRIKGSLSGTAISAAEVVVQDAGGRAIHKESLMKKVEKFYQSHDRSAPASITFRITVDGKKLLTAKGDLEILVTVRDAEGHETTGRSRVRR